VPPFTTRSAFIMHVLFGWRAALQGTAARSY
jgi:hypothetical protein